MKASGLPQENAPAQTYGALLSHWTKMATTETAREKALVNYRKKLLEHRELDARLKESMYILVFYVVVYLGLNGSCY